MEQTYTYEMLKQRNDCAIKCMYVCMNEWLYKYLLGVYKKGNAFIPLEIYQMPGFC